MTDRSTDLFPLCLGANTFGWTSDQETSFAVLDAFRDGGGSMVDTADSYGRRADGSRGDTSEQILGRWLAERAAADEIAVATKVAQHPEFPGLSPENIRRACDASLQRLGLDAIDLYYAHQDDPAVPLAETLGAFQALVDAGKVRYLGVSNYAPDRLHEWLTLCDEDGYDEPLALQTRYSLVERAGYEQGYQDLAESYGLDVYPYYSLAGGFLTGTYRRPADAEGRARGELAGQYLTDDGLALLGVLDEIAAAHGVGVAPVALAWLTTRGGIAAALASARTVEQLRELMKGTELRLNGDELELLENASAPFA